MKLTLLLCFVVGVAAIDAVIFGVVDVVVVDGVVVAPIVAPIVVAYIVAIKLCFQYVTILTYRHKAWLRGSNNSINGQCGGCRAPVTMRDSEGGKPYISGYSEDFVFELDSRVRLESFRCNDDRLRLTHNEMYEQGVDAEFGEKLAENGEEDKVRSEEIKVAYGCKGLCDAIRLIPWLYYTTFFALPICHNLLLGLHGQIPGSIRDVVGEPIFDYAVRASDKMLEFVRRPTEIKRPTKRLLPVGSFNLFSGFKIEDHLHGMETFEPLIFYDIFDKF
jgi:hypothetical protein